MRKMGVREEGGGLGKMGVREDGGWERWGVKHI